MMMAFIIGVCFSNVLQYFIVDTSQDLDIATTYTQGICLERARGLANPLISYQSFFLFAYTYREDNLKSVVPHYYTIRTAYLYSTFILTAFSMFTALSGRTSTMFATLEFVIITSIIYLFNKRDRWIAYFFIGGVLSAIMYLNIGGRV